jgi:hypothetical protein
MLNMMLCVLLQLLLPLLFVEVVVEFVELLLWLTLLLDVVELLSWEVKLMLLLVFMMLFKVTRDLSSLSLFTLSSVLYDLRNFNACLLSSRLGGPALKTYFLNGTSDMPESIDM